MFVLANFLEALGVVLNMVLTLYMWIIIAHAVLSWVSPDPYNPIVRFINNMTEPLLFRIRQKIPVTYGGVDFAPMVVLLAIIFIRIFVVQSLIATGQSLLN